MWPGSHEQSTRCSGSSPVIARTLRWPCSIAVSSSSWLWDTGGASGVVSAAAAAVYRAGEAACGSGAACMSAGAAAAAGTARLLLGPTNGANVAVLMHQVEGCTASCNCRCLSPSMSCISCLHNLANCCASAYDQPIQLTASTSHATPSAHLWSSRSPATEMRSRCRRSEPRHA